MALIAKAPERESTIDYTAINKQVDEDIHDARVAFIVDLGLQKKELAVRDGDSEYGWPTYFLSEQEAYDAIDQAEDIVGEYQMSENDWGDQPQEVKVDESLLKGDLKKQKLEVEEGDTVYKVNFCIYEPKPSQEVVYVFDLVDTYVDYGFEDQEPMQYRYYLTRRNFITKKISGLNLSAEWKDGKQVLMASSTHAKLAKAIGKPEIIESRDITQLLNGPVGIPVEHNEVGDNLYLKFKAPQGLSKKQLKNGITELDCEPLVVDFEDVTVEVLEKAKLRRDIVAKIKEALNYEGSKMQKAIEEWEAKKEDSRKEKDEEAEEKTSKSKASKSEPKKSKKEKEEKTKKSSKETKPEVDSKEDEDLEDFFDVD